MSKQTASKTSGVGIYHPSFRALRASRKAVVATDPSRAYKTLVALKKR